MLKQLQGKEIFNKKKLYQKGNQSVVMSHPKPAKNVIILSYRRKNHKTENETN